MLDLGDIKARLTDFNQSQSVLTADITALVAEVEQMRQALSDSAVADAYATAWQAAHSDAWQLIGRLDMALELIIGSGSLRQIRMTAKKLRAEIKAGTGNPKTDFLTFSPECTRQSPRKRKTDAHI